MLTPDLVIFSLSICRHYLYCENTLHLGNINQIRNNQHNLLQESIDSLSLLLLEPGEIYFTDVGVTLIKDPNKSIKEVGNFSRGRLKICSKSIVFVPQVDHFDQEPLLKFPLCDCTEVKGKWYNRHDIYYMLHKEAQITSICFHIISYIFGNVM